MLFPRHILHSVEDALDAFPVVVLTGIRQCGKTTLAELVARTRGWPPGISLDDAATLAVARDDPRGLLLGLPRPLVIDEVQRAPSLIAEIKRAVDEERTQRLFAGEPPPTGRFLLTGSADIWSAPGMADETLTGRAAVLRVHPLTQAEIERTAPFDLEGAFAGSRPAEPSTESDRVDLAERVVRGGLPLVVTAPRARRPRMLADYVDGVVRRESRVAGGVRDTAAFGRLLRLLGVQTGAIRDDASLARDVGVRRETVVSYCELLERLHVLERVPAWSANVSSRVTRSPRRLVADSGLAASLARQSAERIADPIAAPLAGALFATFVTDELLRTASLSADPISAYHLRERGGQHEVDLVLERGDGALIGVEVKLASSAFASDARHLAWMRDRVDAGDGRSGRFALGLVIHAGERVLPLGERIYAMPVTCLWS